MTAMLAGYEQDACTSLPYGDEPNCAGPDGPLDANAASPLHFAGQHHDDETGLDHFQARNYTSTWGRWMTPDWSASPASVPYASVANPQTLDLYGYTLGNPATNADPDGHWCFLGKFGTTCPAKQPAKSADPTHPDNPLSFQLEEWAALAFAAGPGQTVQQARQLGQSFKEHPWLNGALFGLSAFVGPRPKRVARLSRRPERRPRARLPPRVAARASARRASQNTALA